MQTTPNSNQPVDYLAETEARLAGERASIAPAIPLQREPVLDAPEDKPKEKDVQLTSSDDFLPYLPDIDMRYDRNQQAWDMHTAGAEPQPGMLSNQYIKPNTLTIQGYDVATGDKIFDRGNPESVGQYRSGLELLREGSYDTENGYDVTSMRGLTSVAGTILGDGGDRQEYDRAIDRANVPPAQADATWQAAELNQLEQTLNDYLHADFSDADEQALPDTGLTDIPQEEMVNQEGWLDAAKYIYGAEEGAPFEGTPEQLFDWYKDEMSSLSWRLSPTVGNMSSTGYYLTRGMTQGQEYAQNLITLMDLYDKMDTSAGLIFGENIPAMATDPTFWTGLGIGTLATKSVGRSIVMDRFRSALTKYALPAAAAGATEGGAVVGAIDAATQGVEMTANPEQEYDPVRTAVNTGIGAVAGATLAGGTAAAIYKSPEAVAAARRGYHQLKQNSRTRGSGTPISRQRGSVGVPPGRWAGIPSLQRAFDLADANHFPDIRDLKMALQAIQRDQARGHDLTKNTPENDKILSELLLQDARTALVNNANAIGWYDRTTKAAMATLELIHPELATDPNAKFAFTYALAVTSNGLEVGHNFRLAEEIYSSYKATGKMPTDKVAGTAGSIMRGHFERFNKIVEKDGIDPLRELFDMKTNVSDLSKLGFKVSGEHADVELYGSAIIGPKIGGGFYSNLNGRFDELTMDRWLRRTWGRLTGDLVADRPDMVAQHRGNTKAFIRDLRRDDPAVMKQVEAVTGPLKTNSNEAVMDAAKRLQRASSKAPFRNMLDSTDAGSMLRRASNNVVKWADGQIEAPSAQERKMIRRQFGMVLEELQKEYPDMTMADLQALLWYPEKRLYDKATSKKAVAEGYDDDEAPDYANAARDLALSMGIKQKDIKTAVNKPAQE